MEPQANPAAAAAAAHRHLFISAFIVTAQNGYGRDVDHALHLAHETWDEEQLFDAVKDLPHGALRQMDVVVYPRFCSEEERKTVVDPYGKKRTRLMCAAQAGDVPRLRWLLARGARLELKDWEGHNALWWACYAGRKETMRELLSRGAPLNPADGAPLHGASAGGQVEVVRELLSRGAQLELKDEKGRSALWWACDAGRVEMARELQARGAAAVDNYYWGAAVDARDDVGVTSLHTARLVNHLEVVRELLSRGAVVDAKSVANCTPLLFASYSGHLEVVQELLARGAAVNAASDVGYSALHYASTNDHLEVARELLARGAAVNAETSSGHTPLYLATTPGCHHPTIANLLRAAGGRE